MSFFGSRLTMTVLVGTISMFVLGVGMTGIAQADDVFNVTTQTDTSQGDDACLPGDCSLRQAVEASNNSAGDNDTINVPAGTYLLDDGRLKIDRCQEKVNDLSDTGSLTIKGAGARDTFIDGQGDDRVIKNYCAITTITDLTVQHGHRDYGAGIWNRYGYFPSELTLRDVNVTENLADDCQDTPSDAAASDIVTCYSPGQGAGIYNEGFLTVEQSLINDNTAAASNYYNVGGSGGGIYNQGIMNLTNTTLTGNVAQDAPDPTVEDTNGFDYWAGTGGGIFQSPYFDAQDSSNSLNGSKGFDPTSRGLNLTIANNTAGYGGGVSTFNVANDTQAEGPTLSIDFKNTIIANNTGTFDLGPVDAETNQGPPETNNCFGIEGTITSSGHNLESGTECNFVEAGDQQSKDPVLGALANNTGPTNTLALLDGSPAIDTADNSGCPGIDQRHVTRPQHPTCDIGAYEKEFPTPVTPTPAAAAAAVALAKPVAKSSISGPRSCVKKSGTVRVSGANISSVTYSLNGKKKKTSKGNKTSYRFTLTKGGVSRITASIKYTSATGAKAQTKRFSVSKCAKKAAAPKFTG